MLQIFTVYDKIAREYGQLFILKNQELAIEEITTLFRNGVKCGYTDNPSRYALYELGTYNGDKGLIAGFVGPKLVKNLTSIKDDFMQLVMSQENKYTLPPSPTGNEVIENQEELTCG